MIAELLAQLGNTSEEIAESLRKAGIRGRRKSACGCPLANWLDSQPNVSLSSISRAEIICCCNEKDIMVKTPRSAKKFVNDFDAGKYPDLEA